jgi:hypothetical protein
MGPRLFPSRSVDVRYFWGVPQFSLLAFSLTVCPNPRLVVFLSPKFGRNSPPFKSPCPSAPLSPEFLPIDISEAPDRPPDDDDEDDDDSPNVLEPTQWLARWHA